VKAKEEARYAACAAGVQSMPSGGAAASMASATRREVPKTPAIKEGEGNEAASGTQAVCNGRLQSRQHGSSVMLTKSIARTDSPKRGRCEPTTPVMTSPQWTPMRCGEHTGGGSGGDGAERAVLNARRETKMAGRPNGGSMQKAGRRVQS
jgi:hypothetical protein